MMRLIRRNIAVHKHYTYCNSIILLNWRGGKLLFKTELRVTGREQEGKQAGEDRLVVRLDVLEL